MALTRLPASAITSGTFENARISAGSVTQHVTATDLQPIKSDISALALREATNETSAAFNLPNQFIETFTDDTNLGTQTTGDRLDGAWMTVYATAGSLETGNQSSNYTISQGGDHLSTNEAITSAKFMDGVATGNATNAFYFTVPSPYVMDTSDFLKFDLGSGNSKVFTGFKWFQYAAAQHNYGIWDIALSNDDSSYTTVATDVELTMDVTESSNLQSFDATWSNGTAYRYLKFIGSGTSTNAGGNYGISGYGWGQEIQFQVGTATASATGTLIQSANAVASAKTKVGGTMLMKDNAGTATLGTDLKIYFTCNGGTNWTEATSYTAITPVYSTGVKQVRLGETTCTSGTDVRYKAVWANQASGSKETQLHGIGVNY